MTVLTFVVIGLQAWWTRKAAQATQLAAEGARDNVIEIRKQVGLMERQTKATEKAAEAARVSSNALIDIERAWIIVSTGKIAEPTAKLSAATVKPPVKNFGKTVARIVEFSIKCECIDDPTGLLPEPKYEPGYKTDIIAAADVPLEPMIITLPPQDYQSAIDFKKALYIYGYVDYMILGGERRQTRFCFMYYTTEALLGLGAAGFYVGIQSPDSYRKCT